MDSPALKGVKIKAAAFAPPIYSLAPQMTTKDVLISCHWVNWIMARIICLPTVCPQLVLDRKKRMVGTHFNSIFIFNASACFPSVFWYMDLRKDSILIDICTEGGKAHVFSSSLRLTVDGKVQFREGIIFK